MVSPPQPTGSSVSPYTPAFASNPANSATSSSALQSACSTITAPTTTPHSSGINSTMGPQTPILTNAGIPGPIPADFDFDARITLPDGVARFELPLAVRIEENVGIEKYNNASILKTIETKNVAVPRPVDLDIGPPLKPLYFYSDDEVHELVGSEALCSLYAPLPASLLREVVSIRANLKGETEVERQAQKNREKEADSSTRSKLLGSMEMTNPIERSLGEAREVVIPTVYLLNIRNRYPPPLHFFTNARIDQVNNSPQTIHTKVLRPFGAGDDSVEKVQLLDLAKMILLWGNDDVHECLTPLRFLEASKNLLSALQLLSRPPSDLSEEPQLSSKSTNHAIEYEKHLNYFQQVEDFENSYSRWYKFEREARLEILMSNVVFNWQKYASRVDVILQSYKVLADDRRRMGVFPPAKVARNVYASDVTSSRESARGNQFFRDAAPACLLCGKAHRFPDHPGNIASFDDRRPLFSRLAGNQLVVAKTPKGGAVKRICGVYNLNRSCDNRHGSDALHICSLCGGTHPAFARSPECSRVSNHQIRC
ncbi:hypothetical protein C0992_000433 [Termitomyces sp. T32_za158]|nr:hypothetical protein C0992_000433 [Termitomyces sp. T32_za158]